MRSVIHPDFKAISNEVAGCVSDFDSSGELLGKAGRNTIKIFDIDGFLINIKSFKVPHLVNSVIYRYFRKSKAQRSYEYANRLLEKGFLTPKPIGFFENNSLLFRDSYYVSEQLNADLTFRELTINPDYPDHGIILKKFVEFTFRLHESGIEFLDHTPGNTLIKKSLDGTYEFYLVDLNRMKFHSKMNFSQRVFNFSRLTNMPELVEAICFEYCNLYKCDKEKFHAELLQYIKRFQNNFARKKRLKKKLYFWR